MPSGARARPPVHIGATVELSRRRGALTGRCAPVPSEWASPTRGAEGEAPERAGLVVTAKGVPRAVERGDWRAVETVEYVAKRRRSRGGARGGGGGARQRKGIEHQVAAEKQACGNIILGTKQFPSSGSGVRVGKHVLLSSR